MPTPTKTNSSATRQPYSLRKIILEGCNLDSRSWEYAVSEELSRSTGVLGNRQGVMVPLEALAQRSGLLLILQQGSANWC
jgi:hypothetical protein